MKDKRGRIDVWQQREGIKCRSDDACVRCIHNYDQLAFWIAAMNLAAGERENCSFDVGEALGPRLYKDARDLAARRKDDRVRMR